MGDDGETKQAEFRRRLAQAVKDGGGAVRLGKDLGIPKSNIYNWLNGTVSDPPVSEIGKIARATGYDLDWIMVADTVPSSGNFSQDMLPFVGAMPGSRSEQGERTRWTVTSRTLELAGVLPGDVCEFDLSVRPRAGDIVLAQFEGASGLVDVLRVYRPPVLVVATCDPTVDQAPLSLDKAGSPVRVRGTMVRLHRERRQG